MNILRIWAFGALLAMPAEAAKPVAIVYSLTGEASLTASGTAHRPLSLFDRLPAGTTVEVAPGSRLALAFVNGLRYEFGERSRVTLGPGNLSSRTGPVRPLPRVPPLLLESISEADHPGRVAAAVRIRSERITGLYPRRGAAALAEETALRFDPVPGARSYRVEVQDEDGHRVFQTDTEAPQVKLPAGTLDPGLRYPWTVQTLDRPGAVARGEAEIVTLSAGAARARATAREILAPEKPDSLPLLAEIDHSLGLLLEAREDLRAALEREPQNPMLREAFAEIESRLKDGHGSE